MKQLWLLLPAIGLLIPPQAPPIDGPDQVPTAEVKQAPPMNGWISPEEMPEGAVKFASAKDTQSIYVLTDANNQSWNIIDRFPINKLEDKWRVSGGMIGIKGWKSDKYYTPPKGKDVETWTEYVDVTNSFGYTQKNKAIVRKYPDGTRFDDILSVDGIVFEHRVRMKQEGAWRSSVVYEDKSSRPEGYNGLRQSCSSCHREAGTGKYASGLVPGGDTVLSHPLDWSVWQVKE